MKLPLTEWQRRVAVDIAAAFPIQAGSQDLCAQNDEAELTPEQIESRFRAVRGIERPEGMTAAMEARQK